MTALEQAPASAAQADTDTPRSAFARELALRVQEATASLQAAEALEDPLLAQIAEADLSDLRALAARNDVPLD